MSFQFKQENPRESGNIKANFYEENSAFNNLPSLPLRSETYTKWLISQLRGKNCRRVLDAASGRGVDSLILVDHGMDVVSCDDSQIMVNLTRVACQEKNLSPNIKWDVRKANWLTLAEDLEGCGKFDAVICMGNSLFCLIDRLPSLPNYRRCLQNMFDLLKPGGILIIDHRNVDVILDRDTHISSNIYLKHDIINWVDHEVEMDEENQPAKIQSTFDLAYQSDGALGDKKTLRITIPLCPVRLQAFVSLLNEIFGKDCEHTLFGDLKPTKRMKRSSLLECAYYQHVVVKH